MPALVPADHHGIVVRLGRLARPGGPDRILHGKPVTAMPRTFAGGTAEVPGGAPRPARRRVRALHPRETSIRNVRPLSVLSAEEREGVARALGLEALDFAWRGASAAVAGTPDVTHLPPPSRLQAEDGCTLVVDMENLPCQEPAKTIEAARPGHGRAFRDAAKGRRGVTARVEREGVLRVGGRLRLFAQAQRGWRAGGAAA